MRSIASLWWQIAIACWVPFNSGWMSLNVGWIWLDWRWFCYFLWVEFDVGIAPLLVEPGCHFVCFVLFCFGHANLWVWSSQANQKFHDNQIPGWMVQDDPKLPDDGGEMYPNLKEKKVGNSIPGCEISSLPTWKPARWSTSSCDWAGRNQPVYTGSSKGKGLDIQQETSVWVGSPKSNDCGLTLESATLLERVTNKTHINYWVQSPTGYKRCDLTDGVD